MTEVTDWAATKSQLAQMADDDALEDLIDAVADRAIAHPSPAAVPSLIAALDRARSWLGRRSSAIALAICATEGDHAAVQALVKAYRNADGTFVQVAILEALGNLGQRNALARANVTVLILELVPDEDRYLLVAAARITGGLYFLQPEAALRDKLYEITTGGDLAAQAEAWFQLGLIGLGEALTSGSTGEFRARMIPIRATFARAEALEESRPDAVMFGHLADLILGFIDLARDSKDAVGDAVAVAQQINALVEGVDLGWPGYQSDVGGMIASRVHRIAEALTKAAATARQWEVWTNFDSALGELAAPVSAGRSSPSTCCWPC